MNRKRKIIWISAAVLGLLVAAALAVSPVVRYAVEGALSKQYQDFTIGSVSVNLFNGQVTLGDVEASNPGLGKLRFEIAFIDIDLLPAIGKHISIDLVELSNATVEVRRLPGGALAVAGVAPGGEEPAAQTEAKKRSGWSWSVGKINLNDVRLKLVDQTRAKHSVALDAGDGTAGSEGQKPAAPFEMTAVLKRVAVELDATPQVIGETPEVSGTVEIEDFELGALVPFFVETGIKDLKARLNADLMIAFGPGSGDDAVVLKTEGTISLDGLAAMFHKAGGDISMSQEKLTYRGSVSYDSEKGPFVDGSLNVASLRSSQPGSDRALLDVDGLEASGISLAGTERLTVEEVTVSRVDLFEYDPQSVRGDMPLPQALSIPSIKVSGLSMLDLKQIRIKDITLRDTEAFVLITDEGKLEPVTSLANLGGEKSGDGQKPNDGGMEVLLGRVALEGESRLFLYDMSTMPDFRMELAPLEAEVEQLDTSGQEQASMQLSSGIGRSGTLKAKGTLRLFGQKTDADIKGDVRNVNLPDMNPYLIRHFSYQVKGGNIDVKDIKVGIKKDNLDAQMDIRMNRLDVEKATQKGRLDADEVLGMPFRSAIKMITDDDGVVRLDVKIEGNIADPKFEIDDVIRKAVLNAVKRGAVTYFGPLGVQLLTGLAVPTGALGVAKKFYDYITAVRFDPVTFAPGTASLSQKQHEHLDTMAGLLKDRPKTQLIICGIVVPKDRKNIFTGDDKGKQEGSAARELLLGLARQRADAVADYLVSQGVKEKQLFICAPEVSEDEGDVPRVEVGI